MSMVITRYFALRKNLAAISFVTLLSALVALFLSDGYVANEVSAQKSEKTEAIFMAGQEPETVVGDVTTTAFGATTTVSYTGPAVNIPDANTAGVNIIVPVAGVADVEDFNFRFDTGGACDSTVGNTNAALNHTFVGDLRIKVISPGGITRIVYDRRGGTRENFCNGLLDDHSNFALLSTLTSVTGSPVSGNFAPSQPVTAFNHKSGNGNWTINISDNAGSDTGTIRRFSLIFNSLFPSLQETPFDITGDGRTDVGISRPNGAIREWWWMHSSPLVGSTTPGTAATVFGLSGDNIAPADFTGDGIMDIAQFRPSTGQWFVLRSEDSAFYGFNFGVSGDVPAPADYDGDAKADPTVYRPSSGTWFIFRSSDNQVAFATFGVTEDRPAIGDYDGDGKYDIAVWKPNLGQWFWINSSTSLVSAFQFGSAGDKQVPGDYDGGGKTDIAVWRPTTGQWFHRRSEDGGLGSIVPFGVNGDVPVPGDYDGDGRHDQAVFRPTGAGFFFTRNSVDGAVGIFNFGAAADQPFANAYVRP